jgi:hypothetical protein
MALSKRRGSLCSPSKNNVVSSYNISSSTCSSCQSSSTIPAFQVVSWSERFPNPKVVCYSFFSGFYFGRLHTKSIFKNRSRIRRGRFQSNQILRSHLTSDDIESWENVRESLRLGHQPWAPVKPPGPTDIHNKRIRIPWGVSDVTLNLKRDRNHQGTTVGRHFL